MHALIALFAVNVSQAGARTDNRLCTGALIAAFRRAAPARVAARSPIGGASWWETHGECGTETLTNPRAGRPSLISHNATLSTAPHLGESGQQGPDL